MEASAALQSRNKNRWPTLSVGGPPSAAIDYLCRTTPGGGSEVTKTYAAPNPTIGGQVDVVVAGPTGPVSSSALAAITSYVNTRMGLCTKAVVQNASVQVVAVTGSVYVQASQLAAAQAAISVALSAYEASVPIAGLVEQALIIAAVVNQAAAGVRNFRITTPAGDTQLPAATVVQFDLSGLAYVLQ
jgi:hypothetical protein